MRSLFTAGILVIGTVFSVNAIMVTPVALGARNAGLAGNTVALSSDATAFITNPAGLAFTPVREISASLEYLRQNQKSSFFETTVLDMNQRIRLGHLALLRSFPTSQGGFAINLGFASPYAFDDVSSFKGDTMLGPDIEQVKNEYVSHGQLNQWGGGFGIQVAPGLGIGASLSLVTGKEIINSLFFRSINGTPQSSYDDDYTAMTNRRFLGLDAKLGLMYSIHNAAMLGLRIDLPSPFGIGFDQTITYTYPDSGDVPENVSTTGQLTAPLTGAFGFTVPLPFLTLSTEMRVRAPFAEPRHTEAENWKVGGGAGLEVPLSTSGIILRGGYSYDEFDPYRYLFQYESSSIDTSNVGAVKNRQSITGGLSFLPGPKASIDVSYGYSFWEVSTEGANVTLYQTYISQRATASISIRY